MSVRKPIGNITAYAAAVEGGYTGTYEQFCADQAKFAENARQVAENLAESKKIVEEMRSSKVEAVRFIPQELSSAQQTQARTNIGAASAAETANHASRLDSAEARIEAMEQRTVAAPYYVDNGVAYSKDVPANALPSADVNKIGGATRKSTNLIPFPYAEITKTENGITWTVNSDGSVTANGTATEWSYLMLNYGMNWSTELIDAMGSHNVSNGKSFIDCGYNPNNGWLYLYIPPNITVTNKIYYPRINIGTEPLPYEPYFDGLRSAAVTEVESVGINIWDEEWEVGGIDYSNGAVAAYSGNIRTKNYIPVLPNTSYYKHSPYVLAMTFYDKDKNFVYGEWTASNKSFVTKENVCYMKFCFGSYTEAGAMTEYNHNICINISNPNNNGKYYPYRSDTIPIPAAVQALDGYGWGVNADCYNYIDWEKKQFVKRVGRVDMGTLNWNYVSTEDLFWATNSNVKPYGMVLSPIYETAKSLTNEDFYTRDKVIIVFHTFNIRAVNVKNTAYSDGATFKAAMSGVMLYYELETPIITDISDLLTEDGYIPVEPGGTITMVNEHGYDVPSEITFARLTWQ